MVAFYVVGYVAVAGIFYFRAYRSAPVMEELETPTLTLWVNPELQEEQEELKKAA